MDELRPEPDPQTTTLKLVFVLVLLAIAVTGLVYSSHLLWTLPPAPSQPVALPK